MRSTISSSILFAILASIAQAQYTATYYYPNLPGKTEGDGQTGTNSCGTQASQTSMCQNVFINSANDFCLWGPPGTNPAENSIGTIEEIVVSYCLNDGYGTRLLPSGTITSAHFVKVQSDYVSYVQVTGNGDFTKINIPAGDFGGELDPHSWTGLGNPQGGLVFTNAFSGNYEQTHEWTSFQSASNFCIKACRDGPNAAAWCEHIYDVLGCGFTIPGSFDGGFDDCDGSPAEAPGVYSGSTFHQGDASTPAPHSPGPTSNCKSFNTVGGGSANVQAAVSTTSASASSSTTTTTTTGSMSNNSSMSSSITGSMSNSSSISMTITTAPSSTPSGMTTSRTTSSISSSSSSGSAAAAAATTSRAAAHKQVGAGMGGSLALIGAGLAALL